MMDESRRNIIESYPQGAMSIKFADKPPVAIRQRRGTKERSGQGIPANGGIWYQVSTISYERSMV